MSETAACAWQERPSCLPDSHSGGHRQGSVTKVPSPGLASQTSRCTKKSQRLLSPVSGQSTGRGGLRILPGTGGSDEAGAFSLLVPSAFASLYASSRETEGWGCSKEKNWCVWGGVAGGGVPGRRGQHRDAGGQVSSLPWCGFALMADAGATVRPLELSTRQLCVGGGSYTAGFQTITLNICKQIKKQSHPVQVETSLFLSLSAPSARPPLLAGVGGRGGQGA